MIAPERVHGMVEMEWLSGPSSKHQTVWSLGGVPYRSKSLGRREKAVLKDMGYICMPAHRKHRSFCMEKTGEL